MEFITYESKNRTAYISLNRPTKRNALNYQVIQELKRAHEKAEQDQNVKVIVLKAEGKVFCAGADLAYIQSLASNTYEENLEDSNHLKELFYQLYTGKKPIIGAIQGHAIAGGCGLATLCDFSFSVPEAKFGYTEVRIGFIPALVLVFLLRKMGETAAKYLLLSGELIQAKEAQELGLITKVVPPEKLMDEVSALATMLCEKNSSQAMANTKQMIAKVQELPLETALDYAAERNAQARGNEDCKKGFSAFLEKKEISW